jgi:2-furoyl-CoA dehydrogenase FAD binding subunit
MKPASFDLFQPKNWQEVLEGLQEYGEDAQILAGGQSLIAMLNMRIAKPKVLIDINSIEDDVPLIDNKADIEISALLRQLQLENRIKTKEDLPLISECLPYIGHQQHRARGTIIGSLCHADPSSELPLCFIALKGQLKLNSLSTKRIINAEDFFIGPLLNSRNHNEVVKSVIIPKAKEQTGYAFKEISEKHGDFALASFAAIASHNNVRFVVGGVSDKITARDWITDDLNEIESLVNDFAWDIDTATDQYTTDRYKRDIIRNLGFETIKTAINRKNAR